MKAQASGFAVSGARLKTQPKLLDIIQRFNDEKRQIELIFLVESICRHKIIHEKLEVRNLNEVKDKIKVIQEMIRLELK